MFELKETDYSALEEGNTQEILESETIATHDNMLDAIAQAGGDAFYDSQPVIVDTETSIMYVTNTDDAHEVFKHWSEYFGDILTGHISWNNRDRITNKQGAMLLLAEKMASCIGYSTAPTNEEMVAFAKKWELPFDLELYKSLRAMHRMQNPKWDSSQC